MSVVLNPYIKIFTILLIAKCHCLSDELNPYIKIFTILLIAKCHCLSDNERSAESVPLTPTALHTRQPSHQQSGPLAPPQISPLPVRKTIIIADNFQ